MANIIKIGGGSGGSSTIVSKTITTNGTYYAVDDNADGFDPVVVSVSGSVSKTLVYSFNLSQGGAWLNTNVDVTDIDVFMFERVDNSDVNNQTLVEKSDIAVYTGGPDVYTNVYRQNGKDMSVRIYNNILYVSYGSSGSSSYVSNVYSVSLSNYI